MSAVSSAASKVNWVLVSPFSTATMRTASGSTPAAVTSTRRWMSRPKFSMSALSTVIVLPATAVGTTAVR